MKRYTKAGLLIITLVIPALIFIFLRLFGTNHYQVPFFHALTDWQGNIIVSGADTSFYQVDCEFVRGSDSVALGKQSLGSHLTVINYMDGTDDDTSRLVLAQLDRVYAMRSDIEELNLITIAGTKFAKAATVSARIDQKGWTYVSFPPAVQDSVLYDCLKMRTRSKGDIIVSSKRRLVLVDYDGHIRGYYDGASEEETERLMAEIKILNYEKNIEK